MFIGLPNKREVTEVLPEYGTTPWAVVLPNEGIHGKLFVASLSIRTVVDVLTDVAARNRPKTGQIILQVTMFLIREHDHVILSANRLRLIVLELQVSVVSLYFTIWSWINFLLQKTTVSTFLEPLGKY